MGSLFTKIIQGDIPCHKLYEDDQFFSFLDIRPLHQGHALVIPKKEVDYIFDLDEETYQGLWNRAKKIAAAIEASVPCKKVGIAVVGLEVPHTHVHLVPIDAVSDMNFANAKEAPQDALAALAEKIRAAL